MKYDELVSRKYYEEKAGGIKKTTRKHKSG
jgi:hypothetical protein